MMGLDKSANYMPVGTVDGTHGWGYNPRASFDPYKAYKDENGNFSAGSAGMGLGIPLGFSMGANLRSPMQGLRSYGGGLARSAANAPIRESIGYGQSAIRDMVGGLLGRAGVKAYQDPGLAQAQQSAADRWRQNFGAYGGDYLPGGVSQFGGWMADNIGYIKGGLDHYNIGPGEAASWAGNTLYDGTVGNLGRAASWLGDISGYNAYAQQASDESRDAEMDQANREQYSNIQNMDTRSLTDRVLGVQQKNSLGLQGVDYDNSFLSGKALKQFTKLPGDSAKNMIMQSTPSTVNVKNAPIIASVNKP